MGILGTRWEVEANGYLTLGGCVKHFDGCLKEGTLHMALRLATLSMTRTSVADTRQS
jgi:hypothetical protein